MLKSASIIVLLTGAAPVFAQTATPPSPNSEAASVLGATGTTYDGNNARLTLPAEQNAWFAENRAGYVPAPAGAPAAATGAGAVGSSLGTKETGGEH